MQWDTEFGTNWSLTNIKLLFLKTQTTTMLNLIPCQSKFRCDDINIFDPAAKKCQSRYIRTKCNLVHILSWWRSLALHLPYPKNPHTSMRMSEPLLFRTCREPLTSNVYCTGSLTHLHMVISGPIQIYCIQWYIIWQIMKRKKKIKLNKTFKSVVIIFYSHFLGGIMVKPQTHTHRHYQTTNDDARNHVFGLNVMLQNVELQSVT